jgi:hypothetical protein
MKKIPQQIKAYPLSNQDIQDILAPDTEIHIYPDFASMSSIDEAFDKLGRCIFLFLTESKSAGHWLCMIKRGDTIEYWDSYGKPPEEQRNWLSQEELDALNEGEPYLMNLLEQSGYKVYYNTHKYQKESSKDNECGRWVVARLVCKDISNDEFLKLVKKGMKENNLQSEDDWVSAFIYDILGK